MLATISIQSKDLWLISVACGDRSEVLQVPKQAEAIYLWPSAEVKTLAFGLEAALDLSREMGATEAILARSGGDATLVQRENRLILMVGGMVIYQSPDCTRYHHLDCWRFLPGCLLYLSLNKRHKLYRIEFPKLVEKPLDNTGE